MGSTGSDDRTAVHPRAAISNFMDRQNELLSICKIMFLNPWSLRLGGPLYRGRGINLEPQKFETQSNLPMLEHLTAVRRPEGHPRMRI